MLRFQLGLLPALGKSINYTSHSDVYWQMKDFIKSACLLKRSWTTDELPRAFWALKVARLHLFGLHTLFTWGEDWTSDLSSYLGCSIPVSFLPFGGGAAPQKAKLDMYWGAVAAQSLSTTGTSEQTHFKGEEKKTLNFNENKPVIKGTTSAGGSVAANRDFLQLLTS